ncbi:hypothetical protein HY251_07900, partial [bacterium]|nr:hypothetical protein [bacterium]
MAAHRKTIGFASILAAALAGALAHAGEDERLVWELGLDCYRYDLDEDLKLRMCPDAGLAPSILPAQLVSSTDFEKQRRYKIDIRQVGELVWHYALHLPEGEYGAKGGSLPVEDPFSFPSVKGEIVARGQDEVRRNKDGTATATVTLALAHEKIPTAKPNEEQQLPIFESGATLKVERTFTNEYKGGGPPPAGERRRLVTEAKFELTLSRKSGTKLYPFKNVGRIVLAGKVDATQKQFLSDVIAAIGRGSRWLRVGLSNRLNAFRGSKDKNQVLGKVALPTFALLRSGVPPSDLKDAFEFMGECELKEVYSVSVYIMALEARSIVREEVPAVQNGRTVARFRKTPLPPADKERMSRAARWLIATRKHGEGWWSYGGNPGHELDPPPKTGNAPQDGIPLSNGTGVGPCATKGDRSNSQFATLALHVAATSGIPVDWNVWKEIADECVANQEGDGPAQSVADVEWTPQAPPGVPPEAGPDPFAPGTRDRAPSANGAAAKSRGWKYDSGWHSWGSMTGAGLMQLVIAREGLRRAGKLDKELDQKAVCGIRDGVAWWEQNWTPSRHVKKALNDWYYYYMYSVEKGMETSGVEKLGPHDWWREGSSALLTLEDSKKGRWNGPAGEDVDDTSFALLFLNRATLPATIVVQDQVKIATGEQDPEAWDQVFVDGTGYVRLRQVLAALEGALPEQLKTFLKVAEKGFDVLEEDRRPRLVPDLLRLLGATNKDVHKLVLRALRESSGFEDELRARAFHARWQEVAHACEHKDEDAIPKIRAILRDAEASLPLKRAA